jgi:hypothetical protein
MDPWKIKTITTMPTSINVIKIERFFGTTSFYLRYFQDFAIKVAPMCELIENNEKLIWNDSCIESWEWMKASMTCLPVQIVHNWNVEFHVHINASHFSIGVMLEQNLDNTINKPIYFVSRLMTNVEKNYSTIEKKHWK